MKNQDLRGEQNFCGKCGSAVNKEDKFCGNCGEENIKPSLVQSENNLPKDDLKIIDNNEIKNKIKKFKCYWLGSLILSPFFTYGFPKLKLFLNLEYLIHYIFQFTQFAVIEFLIAIFIVRFFNLEPKSNEHYLKIYKIALVLNIMLLVGVFSNLNSLI